jgi:hypothetical protein
LKCLSSSDQTLFTNIFGAYERIYPETNNCRYPAFPIVEYTTPHTFFNDYDQRHKLLVEYFKLIPEFNKLSMDDKIRLLQNQFLSMININEPILVRSTSKHLVISLKNIFGIDLANSILHNTENLIRYTSDPILLKLVLIIQSLSSGINRYPHNIDMDRIYDDTLAIYAGQCVYVELLWRYLLSRLPCEQDAVKFFNKLILDLLFIQRCCFAVDQRLHNLDHEIDKMSPLMQVMWSQ